MNTVSLLEVNKNVNSLIELSRNRVVVIVTRVLTTRIILQSNVITSIEDSYLDLASSLNISRELLNIVKAVRDLEV